MCRGERDREEDMLSFPIMDYHAKWRTFLPKYLSASETNNINNIVHVVVAIV